MATSSSCIIFWRQPVRLDYLVVNKHRTDDEETCKAYEFQPPHDSWRTKRLRMRRSRGLLETRKSTKRISNKITHNITSIKENILWNWITVLPSAPSTLNLSQLLPLLHILLELQCISSGVIWKQRSRWTLPYQMHPGMLFLLFFPTLFVETFQQLTMQRIFLYTLPSTWWISPPGSRVTRRQSTGIRRRRRCIVSQSKEAKTPIGSSWIRSLDIHGMGGIFTIERLVFVLSIQFFFSSFIDGLSSSTGSQWQLRVYLQASHYSQNLIQVVGSSSIYSPIKSKDSFLP